MAVGTCNLPQMKSIWLDEDEEAEKLYGLQAQQFMGQDDEDELLSIMMVNSDKPILSNKKNIDLPPLTKSIKSMNFSTGQMLSSSRKKLTKKKGFLGLFKTKDSQTGKKSTQISTPFGFQHISHADAKTGFESDEEHGVNDEEKSSSIGHQQRPLSKAFVTQRIPLNGEVSENAEERKRVSNSVRMSMQGSISTTSSKYSRFSVSTGRIVSSSTMATSILNETSSPSRLALLNNMEKVYLKNRQKRESDNSDVSLDFLKNYDFPTLVEHKPTICFTPELDTTTEKIFTYSIPETTSTASLEPEDVASIALGTRLNRANSDSQLLTTPEMENKWFNEETPVTRRSVDDVLLCYHQASDIGSPLQLSINSCPATPKK